MDIFIGIAIPVVITAIGIIATGILSHLYHKRNHCRSLGVFVRYDARFFDKIDSSIRHSLTVEYNGRPIDQLQQIEIVVANDGEQAVKQLIEPLRISFPPNARILEKSITKRSHPDIQVEIVQHSNQDAEVLAISFPLLNSGEYFSLSLLIEGSVSPKTTACVLAAEGLPRKLSVEPLGISFTSTRSFASKASEVSVVAILAICPITWVVWSLYLVWESNPSLFPYPWGTYEVSLQSIVFPLLSILMLVLAVGLSIIVIYCGIVEWITSICRYYFNPKERIRDEIFRKVSESEFRVFDEC